MSQARRKGESGKQRERKLAVGAYWVDERATAVSAELDESTGGWAAVNAVAEEAIHKVAGLDMYAPALNLKDSTWIDVLVANSNGEHSVLAQPSPACLRTHPAADLDKPLSAIPPRKDDREILSVILRPDKDAMQRYALKPWNQNPGLERGASQSVDQIPQSLLPSLQRFPDRRMSNR